MENNLPSWQDWLSICMHLSKWISEAPGNLQVSDGTLMDHTGDS